MSLPLPRFNHNDIFSESILSVSLVGNMNPSRWTWNPFDKYNEFQKIDEHIWRRIIGVQSESKPEHTGNYAFRIVLNHNPRRQLKSLSVDCSENFINWQLANDPYGVGLKNMTFSVTCDCEIVLEFDSKNMTLSAKPTSLIKNYKKIIEPITILNSFELNGFVWDDLSMFDKFQTKLPGRSFSQDDDGTWFIDVPLKKNGGIDFRADGVYQFLISANKEEDLGFSAINDGKGTLVHGTGFSSSHGTSMHSGCTVHAKEDGVYRFRLIDPLSLPRIEVFDPKGDHLKLLNQRDGIQLLGSIFSEAQFDPTVEGRNLNASEIEGVLFLDHQTAAGDHTINFAINNELFLDTMGFGCWLDSDENFNGTNSIRGIAWHGKPHEWNICFNLSADSLLRFSYNLNTDEFEIMILSGSGVLSPVDQIKSLSLVGNFPEPLVAWDPKHSSNLMQALGPDRYMRIVHLEEGTDYNYKFVANQSDWQLVFADYELDCFGVNFNGRNKDAGNPTLANLKRNGRLTSHGNPPALNFTALHSGPYRFYADIVSGAYSVLPV